jgi:hypothetical protein
MPTYTLPDDWAAIDAHRQAVDVRILNGTFTALSSDEVDAVTALANATAVKEANPITVLQLLSTTPRAIPHAFRGDLPLGSAGRPAA